MVEYMLYTQQLNLNHFHTSVFLQLSSLDALTDNHIMNLDVSNYGPRMFKRFPHLICSSKR